MLIVLICINYGVRLVVFTNRKSFLVSKYPLKNSTKYYSVSLIF